MAAHGIAQTSEEDRKVKRHSKVFTDPVHGIIELQAICVDIVDTPQFQRLRSIKQLGSAYKVYPGASHNRFEHSIGVCHLAGKLVNELRQRQPELEITDDDELCVQVAGLCHDLGHGPFSHVFEHKVIPKLLPNKKWKHEDASIAMFKFLINDNKICESLGKTNIGFIEDIIGLNGSNNIPQGKQFLAEIVSNKRNGVDADKWDYFARDCHMLGLKTNFNHNRLIRFTRVIDVDGTRQLCFRDKEALDLYEMFHARYILHVRAYQHKASCIVDEMLSEALHLANEHIKFKGKNSTLKKMSEAVDDNDMIAYMKMTDDYLFYRILYSEEPELMRSRELLENIQRRKLHKFVGQTQLKGDQIRPKNSERCADIQQEILTKVRQMSPDDNMTINDFTVDIINLTYGQENLNPINSIRFYTKDQPDKAIPIPQEQVTLAEKSNSGQNIFEVIKEEGIYIASLNVLVKDIIQRCSLYRDRKDGAMELLQLQATEAQDAK